ncbi:hypothetical protein B0H17DRAFT_1033138 [Mycena rosella]|uniref:Uncharacterized protein n=1 Tax=Mycena rosella TaxID=1033263 RepID=A0AAD7MA01_MYCRO|nr:hypothetical protein B0H17DRAFT_1033138 [Mycena rosella]
MHNLVSTAVHEFIASAAFDLHLPSLSDDAWDLALSCTQRELDTRRSSGLTFLYSYIEHAILRAVERQDCPDLELLREAILSDDSAGVHDSYAGQENKQASRAFLVFVEMCIMDLGVPGSVSWFPLLSIPLYPLPALSDHDGASKRRRTEEGTSEPKRPDSTFALLRRLRRRQMLSVPANFKSEIVIKLGAKRSIPTGPNLERFMAKERAAQGGAQEFPRMVQPVTRASTPSPGAYMDTETYLSAQDHSMATIPDQQNTTACAIPPATSESENPSSISSVPPCDATPTVERLFVPTTPQAREIFPISVYSSPICMPEAPHTPLGASYFEDTATDDLVIPEDLEMAAILFINKTIVMVKREELLPTPILDVKLKDKSDVNDTSTSSRPQTEPNAKKKKHQKQATKENFGPSSKKAKKRKNSSPLTGGVKLSDKGSQSKKVLAPSS